MVPYQSENWLLYGNVKLPKLAFHFLSSDEYHFLILGQWQTPDTDEPDGPY